MIKNQTLLALALLTCSISFAQPKETAKKVPVGGSIVEMNSSRDDDVSRVPFEEIKYKNAFKVDVLSPFRNTFRLGYERAITDQTSIGVKYFRTYSETYGYDLSRGGFGVTPEVRFYQGTAVLKGLYAAINAQHFRGTIQDKTFVPTGWFGETLILDNLREYSSTNIGFNIGYQTVYRRVFADVAAGAYYHISSSENLSNSMSAYSGNGIWPYDGYGVTITASFGLRF